METPTRSPVIFISYSRKDESFVDRLERDLQATQYNIWVDRQKLEAGEIWPNRLREAIAICDALILVVTSNSVESVAVREEYLEAMKTQKRIYPIVFDPAIAYPEELRSLKENQVRFDDLYEAGFYDLLNVLKAESALLAKSKAAMQRAQRSRLVQSQLRIAAAIYMGLMRAAVFAAVGITLMASLLRQHLFGLNIPSVIHLYHLIIPVVVISGLLGVATEYAEERRHLTRSFTAFTLLMKLIAASVALITPAAVYGLVVPSQTSNFFTLLAAGVLSGAVLALLTLMLDRQDMEESTRGAINAAKAIHTFARSSISGLGVGFFLSVPAVFGAAWQTVIQHHPTLVAIFVTPLPFPLPTDPILNVVASMGLNSLVGFIPGTLIGFVVAPFQEYVRVSLPKRDVQPRTITVPYLPPISLTALIRVVVGTLCFIIIPLWSILLVRGQ